MKLSRTLVLIAVVLFCGFFAACWCTAQSVRQASGKEQKTDDYITLHQLESFVAHLQKTKQTDTLRLFNDYSNVSIAQQSSVDIGVTVRILAQLREGRTNEVISLLEQRLTSDAVGFVASYRELPASLREKLSLTSLGDARDYRSMHRVRSKHSDVDEIVEKAFTLLDEKNSK